MYSAASVNQFEMKDKCIEFAINVSQQGNNVKIKLKLKINLQRLRGNKWQHTRILFSFMRGIFITLRNK